MAEKAAHLAPILQIRPSLFEYYAQESLNELLYSISHKLVNFFAPESSNFFKIAQSFNEFYYLGYSVLQYLHLKSFGATFAEKFYGLKRQSLEKSKNAQLSPRVMFLSMLTISLFPYLKKKLSQMAEEMSLQSEDLNNDKVINMKKQLVINLDKAINIFWTGAQIYQSIKFMSGASDLLSPLHCISRVKLVYAVDEMEKGLNFSLRKIIPSMFGIGAFFIQFLQTWENNKTLSLPMKSVEPPLKMGAISKINNSKKNECPLCGNQRHIETVLSTSGYVFCFQCISSYLVKHRQCPVTKLPSSVENLIHIYSLM